MNRKLLSLGIAKITQYRLCFISFVLIFAGFFPIKLAAQNSSDEYRGENFTEHWRNTLESIRAKYGDSKQELAVFSRFEYNPVESIYENTLAEMRKENYDPALATETFKRTQLSLDSLYQQFKAAEKSYPSSVNEFRNKLAIDPPPNPCEDTLGCNNMGFEEGSLNSWYGYYAINSSGPPITGWVGGLLGNVTEAANDPSSMSYNLSNCNPKNFTTDYQLSLTSSGHDALVPTIPRVSPFSISGHSVMLGDSTLIGFGSALLEKTFYVTPSSNNVTYEYALVLNNPHPPHPYQAQPFFSVQVLYDDSIVIPHCGEYEFTSGYGVKGFDSVNINACSPDQQIYYKNWVRVNVPLNNYVGQCVTLQFEVADCDMGGHFGYAYVDASCSPFVPLTTSPNFCGQDSILISAPAGSARYRWFDSIPGHAIKSVDTLSSIWVDSAGTYYVIVTPITGSFCNDTLKLTIGKIPGPPPHPNFKAAPVCVGNPTHFLIDTVRHFSNVIDTAWQDSTVFYWDFYNLGSYNDTEFVSASHHYVNPTWTYAAPGVYNVKLYEVHKGCGNDTIIQVVVDSAINGGFSVNNGCVGAPIVMTNTTTPATASSHWIFGDPNVHVSQDTANTRDGTHTYTDTGTYIISLVSKKGCVDTIRDTIRVFAVPNPIIKGKSPVCTGYSDTLYVSNAANFPAATYSWSIGGSTTSQAIISAANEIVTVTVTNGGICSQTATFQIQTDLPDAVITPEYDSVCSKAPDTLKGSGGDSYLWQNNKTTSPTIVVNPTTPTTYTLTVTDNPGGCISTATVTVGIIKPTKATVRLSTDSICQGTSTSLDVTTTEGVTFSYTWSTGATSTIITVSPNADSTFYVAVQGQCDIDTVRQTVHVIPLPTPIITPNDSVCKGANDTLTVTGGTLYLWSNGTKKTTYIVRNMQADSTVSVIAYNYKDKKCAVPATINIPLKLPPNVVTNNGFVCAGSCYTITATPSGGSGGNFTYSWANIGATTYSVSVCPTSDSVFEVTVSNGCEKTAHSSINVYQPTLNVCCSTTIMEYAAANSLVGSSEKYQGDTAILTADSANHYHWSPSSSLNCDTCRTVIATPTVTTTYTVTGIDLNGCTDVETVTVTVEFPCSDIFVANVFTPNGDNINDEFKVTIENLDSYSITIYDRWGIEMFSSNNPSQSWTGTTEGGAKATDGVYYYIITATCNGGNIKRNGFVQLIR